MRHALVIARLFSSSFLVALLLYCGSPYPSISSSPPASQAGAAPEAGRREERERMVTAQIMARDVRDRRVLDAMRKVPRHLFVPEQMQAYAYDDSPLPIGYGQTISQPYVVAFMTEALELKPTDRVLEIGTGSGYQAAILAEIVQEVYSIEIVEPLARQAEERLKNFGYSKIHVRAGDGYGGWPEAAPFDAIIVTAAPDHVPPALVEQLREGGRLVLPLGRYEQDLIRIRRTAKGTKREVLLPVRFVPMVGEAEKSHN